MYFTRNTIIHRFGISGTKNKGDENVFNGLGLSVIFQKLYIIIVASAFGHMQHSKFSKAIYMYFFLSLFFCSSVHQLSEVPGNRDQLALEMTS